MAERIPLSEVVAKVAEELIQAQAKAKARGTAVMQFDECELEFAVEAEREGKAGVNVWALELGGSKKRTESNIVRVKFKSLPDQPLQAAQETSADGPPIKRQR